MRLVNKASIRMQICDLADSILALDLDWSAYFIVTAKLVIHVVRYIDVFTGCISRKK